MFAVYREHGDSMENSEGSEGWPIHDGVRRYLHDRQGVAVRHGGRGVAVRPLRVARYRSRFLEESVMRKMSKADKVAMHDELIAKCDMLQEYAWHVVNGRQPDAVERYFTDEYAGRYAFALYGAMRAHGGIVVATSAYDGQSKSVEVFRFEDWLRSVAELPY